MVQESQIYNNGGEEWEEEGEQEGDGDEEEYGEPIEDEEDAYGQEHVALYGEEQFEG